MVRVRSEGRSKGCENCRKRKIKCDGKLPECSQCVKAGKKCSGPASGLVFLHAKSDSPLSKTKRVVHEREHTQSVAQIGEPSKSALRVQDPKISDMVHVSGEHVFTQQFVYHWISICEDGGLSWMSQVPDMLSTTNSNVVEKSMLASSLAFHGKVSQNTSLMTESYKWYGVGLRAHQKQLQILSNHKKKPSIEEICMAIMLSFFEIISSTTHTAYFQHIMGAMKLLEMVGPEGCREATIGRLYQVVKAQMVYVAIIIRRSSFLAKPEWIAVTFLGRPKTAFDKIVDSLTQIPSLLSKFDSLLGPNLEACEILTIKQEVETRALALRAELHSLWTQLQKELNLEGPDMKPEKSNSMTGRDWAVPVLPVRNANLKAGFSPLGGPYHRTLSHYAAQASLSYNPFTAIAISFYNTAQILLLSILSELRASQTNSSNVVDPSMPPSSTPDEYLDEIEAHSASIISLADMVSQPECGTAYVSMILPLRVLGDLSPSAEQRARCRTILGIWKAKGGIGAMMCEGSLKTMKGYGKRIVLP